MKIYAIPADSEEQLAVVTARTSRSPNTFMTILDEVSANGHKEFIKTNVLGYGHDSVAEMAMCPAIAIEDISDLAGNVIAGSDPQLRVQMTSTRYQDMGKRLAFDARGEQSARGEAMKVFYMSSMSQIQKILDATDHPRKRTLQCDMARAFLPAGISTQLAIRGDARTLRDAVCFMQGHELSEVRAAGKLVHGAVKNEVETLFDRHVTPAPTSGMKSKNTSGRDPGTADFQGVDWDRVERNNKALDELSAWRDSSWRRRMRMAAAPFGPYMNAYVCSDWGAYRDLKRNRTLIQDDVLPDPSALPTDALWAFRELYPDVCAAVDKIGYGASAHDGPTTDKDEGAYTAPMGSIITWQASGHILNWAYALRLRSGTMCHPAYAMPMRYLMNEILLNSPMLAAAIGIVRSPKSLVAVEFSDRVPT